MLVPKETKVICSSELTNCVVQREPSPALEIPKGVSIGLGIIAVATIIMVFCAILIENYKK